MAVITLPDRDYVREALEYNPETGALLWRKRPLSHFQNARECKRWNTRYAGKIAGHASLQGYLRVYVNRRGLLAHRLAWLLARGEPIPDVIDHKDGNTWNNRIANLRAADYMGNLANASKHRDNTTGVKGVFRTKDSGRFMAYITKNRHRHHLGIFDSLEEAAEVRRNAAIRLHGDFAKHN